MEPVATLADVLVFLGETQPGALRGVLQQFPDLEETYGKADNMWERRSRALPGAWPVRRWPGDADVVLSIGAFVETWG